MTTKKDALEKQYRQITGLYDFAEELASTVESEFATQNPEAQLALVEPLIAQVAETADVLSEEYVSLFEVPIRKKSAKGRIESTLRKLFAALEEYRNKVGHSGKQIINTVLNIADPIVDKVRKQVEKIVLIFMQLVELSLERVMHKQEAEEFRRANEKSLTGLTSQLSY